MRRALTMQELMATIAVVTGILVLMGNSLGGATEVHDEVVAISSVRGRSLRVRSAVGRTLRGGWPLRHLALTSTGRPGVVTMREAEVPPGVQPVSRWRAGKDLVCRAPDGYRALAVEGDRLWETRIVAGGVVRRRLIATQVESARFRIVRDRSGEMGGISYRLTLSWPKRASGQGAHVDGFVALRVTEVPPATVERTARVESP